MGSNEFDGIIDLTGDEPIFIQGAKQIDCVAALTIF